MSIFYTFPYKNSADDFSPTLFIIEPFLIHKIICYRFYLYYKVFKNLELDRRDQKNWQITKNWKIYISDILNLEDCVQLEDLKEYKRILEKSKTIVDFKVNINKQYLVK